MPGEASDTVSMTPKESFILHIWHAQELDTPAQDPAAMISLFGENRAIETARSPANCDPELGTLIAAP